MRRGGCLCTLTSTRRLLISIHVGKHLLSDPLEHDRPPAYARRWLLMPRATFAYVPCGRRLWLRSYQYEARTFHPFFAGLRVNRRKSLRTACCLGSTRTSATWSNRAPVLHPNPWYPGLCTLIASSSKPLPLANFCFGSQSEGRNSITAAVRNDQKFLHHSRSEPNTRWLLNEWTTNPDCLQNSKAGDGKALFQTSSPSDSKTFGRREGNNNSVLHSTGDFHAKASLHVA